MQLALLLLEQIVLMTRDVMIARQVLFTISKYVSWNNNQCALFRNMSPLPTCVSILVDAGDNSIPQRYWPMAFALKWTYVVREKGIQIID